MSYEPHLTNFYSEEELKKAVGVHGVILETTPSPNAPSAAAVPYRLPAESKITPAGGEPPSLPPVKARHPGACNGSFLPLLISRINTRLVDIYLEEHEDHYAGDRNVQPNGERQARDSAVHREPARQREKECREHHRQSDDGKGHMAG
jgi:hypothetical protein